MVNYPYFSVNVLSGSINFVENDKVKLEEMINAGANQDLSIKMPSRSRP